MRNSPLVSGLLPLPLLNMPRRGAEKGTLDVPETASVNPPLSHLVVTTSAPGMVIGLGGTQLGLWFSRGQLRNQFVDDGADTRSLAARAIPAVEQCAIAQRVVALLTGAAAWHGHCISGHCSSWGSHGCGVM